MRKLSPIALAIAPVLASAITATKEYVDRKGAETIEAATNAVTVATNALAVAQAAAIASATNAVAHPSITTSTGGETRTETGNIVYSNVRLMIREVPAANGQKQFRLIRRSE